jgi:hypothetical protein
MTRGAPAIAISAVLAATAFLFWPLVFGAIAGEPRFFEWDVPEQYWPDLVYLCESMHRGELPYWNPYDRGGYPYFADPQAAAYHPSSWAICAVAGPSPSLAWANARVVFGFALAGLFGLLWLRRLGAPWSGAIAGATVIEAAPFMRHNWELNLTHALAYLPLMLWAADRLATERRLRDGATLALAVALSGWVGSPPALWLSSGLTFLYLTFRLIQLRRVPRLALIAAAIFTMGLLAAVLVPAAELATHSVQAGRSFESIADEGLTLERTLAFVWPQPGNHLYVGWIALALGALAFVRREQRGTSIFAWAIALASVLMAMGANAPLFRLAFEVVPGVAVFRLPHRYEAWLGPMFGLLVALGLGALREKPGDRRSRIAAAIVAVLGALALLLPGLAPSMLLFGAALVLFARTVPNALASAPLGALLAALILADVSQALPAERHTRAGPDPCADRAPIDPGDHFRVMDEFFVACRPGARLRVRDLRGYQDPLLLASYERVVASLHDHPELAAQLNVRFALQGPHFIHGWDRHYLPLPAERDGTSIHEQRDVLPFAYFVPEPQIERAPDRQTALARTIELAPSAIAIVEGMGRGHAERRVAEHTNGGRASAEREPGGRSPPTNRGRPIATATRLSFAPDALSFTIEAPERGAVIVNEAFYPGWTATIDGEPARIHRANGFVRAVAVEPGRHRVSMRFAPASGRATRIVLAASLVLALAVIAIGVARRAR